MSYLCDLKGSYSPYDFDNSFTIFISVYNILYLIYTDDKSSILDYDVGDKKMVIEIKNAHNSLITNFRHYIDKCNKRDLIISISCQNNNLKLWNVNDWNCVINIENIYTNSLLISACIIFTIIMVL